jgi:hypothetical protein
MFQNAAIDIAIGLILMYLVLSLLCTVINEFIATKLNLRSRNLAAGLRELLDDPVVRNAFYDHGLMSGMKKALESGGRIMSRSAPAPAPAAPAPPTTTTGLPIVEDAPVVVSARAIAAGPKATTSDLATPAAAPVADTQLGDHPSYLSASTFALALVGALTGTRLAEGQATPTFIDVQGSIERLPPSKIKSALQASLVTAQGNFDDFRKSVTTWFDDSMERLSGAYKRHLKLISIVVGCAVAVAMNADTFAAGHALWSDGNLRARMVQTGEVAVKSGLPEGKSARTPEEIANAYKETDQKLRPMPIGWPIREWPCDRLSKVLGPAKAARWIWFVITTLAGWFVTGLALSLGAPFWFDLLSKFVNIRGSGVKPNRQDAKAGA